MHFERGNDVIETRYRLRKVTAKLGNGNEIFIALLPRCVAPSYSVIVPLPVVLYLHCYSCGLVQVRNPSFPLHAQFSRHRTCTTMRALLARSLSWE